MIRKSFIFSLLVMLSGNEIQAIKNRFGIVGNNPSLLRAIDIAHQVAPTDLSVLITGESGVGKEHFPKIIHAYSSRKHGPYFAVNCGAIPEGTIDSELFGHEKGAFTDAKGEHKGYFEAADGGTLFLDEVGELPLNTQVRLLRVLETGEFLRVGASKPLKTNVRVVAATNLHLREAIAKGRFREDLYYRLNTIPIQLPPLRERKDDIPLLFRKFAVDFAERSNMPPIRLTPEAAVRLKNAYWPGNIRQLKNMAELISVMEQEREITASMLDNYLPQAEQYTPMVVGGTQSSNFTDRELLLKFIFELRQEMEQLKTAVSELQRGYAGSENTPLQHISRQQSVHGIIAPVHSDADEQPTIIMPSHDKREHERNYQYIDSDEVAAIEEQEVHGGKTMRDVEKEMIEQSLKRNGNRRAPAAKELGYSERTLYRKIKEYGLE